MQQMHPLSPLDVRDMAAGSHERRRRYDHRAKSLMTNTGSIDHPPLVVPSSPCIISDYAKNKDCSCNQYRVVHISSIDRQLGRPEAEEQNDKDVDDGK